MTTWSRAHILRILKLNENGNVSAWYRVNEAGTEVKVYIDCSDLFYWACSDADEIRPEDLLELEQCLAEMTALDAPYWAGELFCCRRRGMRPQGPWYGYMVYPENVMIRRAFVPIAVEALFDACGPEREDSPKSKRPADGRRWDYGGAKSPADFPPGFVEEFRPGGKFGP